METSAFFGMWIRTASYSTILWRHGSDVAAKVAVVDVDEDEVEDAEVAEDAVDAASRVTVTRSYARRIARLRSSKRSLRSGLWTLAMEARLMVVVRIISGRSRIRRTRSTSKCRTPSCRVQTHIVSK